MTSEWSKTWYTGHNECKTSVTPCDPCAGIFTSAAVSKPCCSSCATGGPCSGSLAPVTRPCCGSCATGGPCEGSITQPARKACCDSCAKGGPCSGSGTVDRHQYNRGYRGVGEYRYQPTAPGEGTVCDTPESCYWPLHRNFRTTRAGLPTHRDLPDLYEDDPSGQESLPEGTGRQVPALNPNQYRRIYHFEKEPYFFAKEYDDPFCHQHPTPWSEDGYYYYKRQKEEEEAAKGEGTSYW